MKGNAIFLGTSGKSWHTLMLFVFLKHLKQAVLNFFLVHVQDSNYKPPQRYSWLFQARSYSLFQLVVVVLLKH